MNIIFRYTENLDVILSLVELFHWHDLWSDKSYFENMYILKLKGKSVVFLFFFGLRLLFLSSRHLFKVCRIKK